MNATTVKERKAAALGAVIVPAGWELLPAGVERHVRVLRDRIGVPGGNVFRVGDGSRSRDYLAVRVLGGCDLVHECEPVPGGCAPHGRAYLRTAAAFLVRVS